MPPECKRCGYRHSHSEDCYPRTKPVKVALHEAYLGPQKQPASLARLKAEVQQVLATLSELEPNDA